MKAKISLGKIAYEGTRKINEVVIELELRNCNGVQEFSAVGNLWNSKGTDTIMGGQCFDELNTYANQLAPKAQELFKEIYTLHKKYHLNTMHAGTPKQEALLKQNAITNWASSYYEVCDFLKSKGMLIDDGYKFGSKWLAEVMPAEDIKKIQAIITNNETKGAI